MSRKTTMFKRASLVAAAGLALVASGCAEERASINQVQPNVLDKSFFIGKDLQDSADDPEFYSQGTLIDVGYGAAQNGLFTSTYAQPLSRIKWVIQENELIGRLTYERIENTDGKGVGPLRNEGIVVAVYPIEKHFDIQKQYNPTTGEELNVIVENASDRPWYARQYFRVDWSKNKNTDSYDFDTLSQLGVYGGVSYEPLSYYINDPNHPDAPVFNLEQGYFDVTNKAFAKPKQIDLSALGWGIKEIPACFLSPDFLGGSAPIGNCNPIEITIRQSFRRVENTDYEPKHWDGHRFQAFGAFLVERQGYARNYGMTDDRWYRFITRYNLWERNHYYTDAEAMTGAVECFTPDTPVGSDPNRDEDGNGTADECETVSDHTGFEGSQCDHFSQKCTLPYRARVAKPIPWYYTEGNNPDYFDSSEWATHEWDVALRSAILAARYAECQSTGGSECAAEYPMYTGQQDDNTDAIWLAREVDSCRLGVAYEGADCQKLASDLAQDRRFSTGVVAIAQMPEMLVLCHSPVEANDPEACGGPRLPAGVTAEMCAEGKDAGKPLAACGKALTARLGDLRYHQVNVIKAPQSPSPWGIYTDAEDPLTGETVSASINVWSHVTDLASQGIIDTSRYIAGELSTEDITEGKYIHQWSEAAKAAMGGGSLPQMTRNQVDEAIAGFVKIPVEELRAIQNSTSQLPPAIAADIQAHRADINSIRWDSSVPSNNRITYETRRQHAIGSNLEASLTTKAMQQFGGAGKLPGAEAQLAFSSPLRAANPTIMRDFRQAQELALAERGSCVLHEAPAPITAVDLGEMLQKKFGRFDGSQSLGDQLTRAEQMRKFVAQRMHYNVMAHEMGHSVGLRHNFVSSSDAFNYRPQYWQLRTDNGTNSTVCTDLDPTGECVGPRYWDPINQRERENLLPMFMQSSVMDYAGELSQDFIGLGAYDFAAARMFYGDVVSVHADTSFNVGQNRGTGILAKMDNFGGTVGFRPSIGGGIDGDAPASPTTQINFHYSQLQHHFDLISDCQEIADPTIFKPATWDETTQGIWHATFDGLIVPQGEGQSKTYSSCKQQPVDYVQFSSLRQAIDAEQSPTGYEINFDRRGYGIDPEGRTRVPYGFATDRWADLGNVSVYRHDNGADVYELFDYLITQTEVSHVFDNYRRGRTTFSVRGAANRTLGRFNEKLRDGAKGLGIVANNVRERGAGLHLDGDAYWALVAADYQDNILTAQIAFDHFARTLARPQVGPHGLELLGAFGNSPPAPGNILRSLEDPVEAAGRSAVLIPNGATGLYGNVTFGGKLIENRLADDKGEYDAEYTINAGSYYDKAWAAMLFTESQDNFISDSRRDFTDPRYRAVSLADLFPDGFRRLLANNLTNDIALKAPRVTGGPHPLGVRVDKDSDGYPKNGIGWISWWPEAGPEICFSETDSLFCSNDVTDSLPIDPQVGWEQQKFLIAYTLLYLPENEKQTWLNQLWLWEMGADSDPLFQNRIEFHDPNGSIYVAKTFGTEDIFGKTVQKGISARVLEYANELVRDAYVTTDGPDLDGNGVPDWYVPVLDTNGQLVVQYDPNMKTLIEDELGRWVEGPPREGCTETENWGCVCVSNKACVDLQGYSSVPAFLREAIGTYGMGHPSMRGIY